LKLRYDLVPPELLEATATVLTHGLEKHGEREWEKGTQTWGSHFGALMRHLWKWWSPIHSDLDEETGKSHLWHAAGRIAMLITYEDRGIGVNDKPDDKR